jgi:hypothetical protein
MRNRLSTPLGGIVRHPRECGRRLSLKITKLTWSRRDVQGNVILVTCSGQLDLFGHEPDRRISKELGHGLLGHRRGRRGRRT